MPGRSRAIAALIVLFLAQLVVSQALAQLPRIVPIDFYQYWAVAAMRRVPGGTLGNPYRDARGYHARLRSQAEQSGQPRFATVARLAPSPSFTATPFLYMLFGALPADYTRASALFLSLQLLLFSASVIALGAIYRYPAFPLISLTLLLVLGSGPLSSDLRVGNLGCLQLAALVGLLALAHRLQHATRARLLMGSLLLTGLTLLALAKPNVALAAAMLAVHVWWVHGTRFTALAAVPAALGGAAAVLVACAYFGSWTVWQDWYAVVFGRNPRTLALAPTGGNYATPVLLARGLGADVWAMTALIAAAMGASLIAVLARVVRGAGSASAMVVRALGLAFGDARLAMAMGVTASIALPPLFWYHYYVIALIPGLWLLNASSGPRVLPLYGLASVALSSGVLNVLFLPLGWVGAVSTAAALSWVPLAAGIVHRLSSRAELEAEAEPARGSTPLPGERRVSPARPVRRRRGSKTGARG